MTLVIQCPCSGRSLQTGCMPWLAAAHGSNTNVYLTVWTCPGKAGWDWHCLASYLLLGLSEEQEHATMLAVPHWCPPCLLPSPHRGKIQSLVDLGTGRYLSVGKEGMLAVWDENLTLFMSHKLQNDLGKLKDLWVTGMVVLPNIHKVNTLRETYSSNELYSAY